MNNQKIRNASPDKAAAILRAEGFPVNAKMLRTLYNQGHLPAIWTGRRLLIPLNKARELFENGMYADIATTKHIEINSGGVYNGKKA